MNKSPIVTSLVVIAIFALILFAGSDKMIVSKNKPKPKTDDDHLLNHLVRTDGSYQYISRNNQRQINNNNNNNNNNQQASSSSSSSSSSVGVGNGGGGDKTKKDLGDFHDFRVTENTDLAKDVDYYRQPIWNGRLVGKDPNRRYPCEIGGDWGYAFRTDDRYMYKSFIPKREILPTHFDDGQYCFVSHVVPNAVFSLQFEERWCCVYVPALHVPSGLFIGADVHFFDYLYRGIVNTKDFPRWRDTLIGQTKPLREKLSQTFWDQYFSPPNSSSSSSSSSSQQTVPPAAAASENPELVRLSVQDRAKAFAQKPNRVPENVFINISDLPPEIEPVPVTTEYVHLLATDLVGMMPAVSIAQFISYWSHFYSSGLQALGPKRITVIVNRMSWGETAGPLVDTFVRYLPVPALYLPSGKTFFARKLSFAPRGYQDVLEPCTFHLLYNYLVPTVVKRIRASLKYGREPHADKNGNNNNNKKKKTTSWAVSQKFEDEGGELELARNNNNNNNNNNHQQVPGTSSSLPKKDQMKSPPPNSREIEPGVFLRMPIKNYRQQVPWWNKEYDQLLNDPPENLAIMKSKAGAYSGRMFPMTDGFRKLLKDSNYVLLSDTAPGDIRMFLINHAKRIIVYWGGGSSSASHFWGGGVKKARLLSELSSSNDDDEDEDENNDKDKKKDAAAAGEEDDDVVLRKPTKPSSTVAATSSDSSSSNDKTDKKKKNKNKKKKKKSSFVSEVEGPEGYEGPDYLDVIMFVHPEYYWELQGLRDSNLKRGGVDLSKRVYMQGSVKVQMGPPNPFDHWSEAGFSFGYAWTKMLHFDNLTQIHREHLFISDEERHRDLGRPCNDRTLERVVGKRTKTNYEFVECDNANVCPAPKFIK